MKRTDGLVAGFAFAVYALALIQVFTLWPAAAHVPLSRPLAGAIVLAAIAFAAWLAARHGGDDAAGAETQAVSPMDVAPDGGGARAASWLAVVATLAWGGWQWIQLLRLTWARPVYDWDGLYYHVPAMNAWTGAGRIHWIPGMDDLPFVNGYPMAVETLGFVVHRLTGTSRLVDAGNLFYWPLAALALAVIATLLGARGPWRWAAGGLLAVVPGWVILSSTCYVDPAFGAATFAAIAAAILYTQSQSRHGAKLALLFGAAGGLMIGAKGQGLPFFGVLFALAFLARIANRDTRRRRMAAHAALVVTAAFVVGGYWALRNLVWSGNPIFPVELKLGAKVFAAGYDTRALLDGNMPAWLAAWPAWLRVPVAWLQFDTPVRGSAATGGLGLVWIAAGVPAVALLWRFGLRGTETRRPLMLLTVIVALLLAVQPAPWWARMTLWLHALGLPALAAVLDVTFRARWRGAGYVASLLLLGVLALGVQETHGAFEAERENDRLTAPGEVPAVYCSAAEVIFPGLESSCENALGAAALARGPWSRFGTLMGGVLAQPLDARRVTVIALPVDEGAVRALVRSGVEWVVWDEVAGGPLPAALRAAAMDSCAYRPNPDQSFAFVRIAEPDGARMR
jgi:hypothetical protein